MIPKNIVKFKKESGKDKEKLVMHSRDWAIEILRKCPGAKITHKSFDNNEYIYTESNGLVYDENHYLFEDWYGDHNGMRLRVGDSWEKGWMIYNE